MLHFSFPVIFADPPYELNEAYAIPGMVFKIRGLSQRDG